MKTQSKKGFTLVEIMIVVVIIGLLAAMAIPAFQKVRANSQNKAVVNNVRQITSAADQYFLENGVTTVAIADLFGNDNYIKGADADAIQVASETYTANIVQGTDYVVTGLPAGAGGAAADDHTPTAASTTITVDF
jgi:type IV pilus assembly protein PilA